MKNDNNTNNNDNPQNFTYTSYPFSLHPGTSYQDLIEFTKLHLQRIKDIINSDHPAAALFFYVELSNYPELAINIFKFIPLSRKLNYLTRIIEETHEDIENCEDPEYKKELIKFANVIEEEFENLNNEVGYHRYEYNRIQSLLKDLHQAIPEFLKTLSKHEK